MTPAAYAGAALAGVVLLAAVTALLLRRARRPRPIETPEEAADAADTLPGFVTAGAVVGSDGMAALAVDGHGRVAAVARRGKRLHAAEIAWTAVHATPAGMTVDTGQRALGQLLVAGVNNLDVRRLAPVLAQR